MADVTRLSCESTVSSVESWGLLTGTTITRDHLVVEMDIGREESCILLWASELALARGSGFHGHASSLLELCKRAANWRQFVKRLFRNTQTECMCLKKLLHLKRCCHPMAP